MANVYYGGTADDWAKISIVGSGGSNISLITARVHYYSEYEPSLNTEGTAYDGSYWHYVDGVATPWFYTKEE